MDDIGLITLILITGLAATINGGLGYGFSSITVPVALLFYANRVLNPAIVLIEVIINAYIVALHIKTVKTVFTRILPVVIGAAPSILIGSLLLSRVESDPIKLITYALLLPLILLQAGGVRKTVRSERAAGFLCGGGIGFFYAITTISGPPLAVILNNQRLEKKEFRAALVLIRLFLSSVTAITYFYLGLFQAESLSLLTAIAPSVILGIPLGVYLIRKMDAVVFRRLCISFDVWLVGFGLSYMIARLGLIISPYAYIFLVLAVLIDSYLLYRHFSKECPVPAEEGIRLETSSP